MECMHCEQLCCLAVIFAPTVRAKLTSAVMIAARIVILDLHTKPQGLGVADSPTFSDQLLHTSASRAVPRNRQKVVWTLDFEGLEGCATILTRNRLALL